MALPIAPGSTETTFANGEFTVTAGTPVGLFITNGTTDSGIPDGIDFELAFKTTDSEYTILKTLNAQNILENSSISVGGTYAVRRCAAYYDGAAAGFEVTGAA